LPDSLGLQDAGPLLALGHQDRAPLLAVGPEDRGPPLAFGGGLLLHRRLDRADGVDLLDLDGVDADAPLIGRLVEDVAQAGVDPLAVEENLVELHVADDRPEGRLRERHRRDVVVLNLEDRLRRVDHLGVDDGVDVGRRVVLRDDFLPGDLQHLGT
jgi:hypothetical protein